VQRKNSITKREVLILILKEWGFFGGAFLHSRDKKNLAKNFFGGPSSAKRANFAKSLQKHCWLHQSHKEWSFPF